MARNEEKQHGRLNRLWLQKAKEEGHIKDINSNRPRLSALHTASDVKKWIPSIKNEIEYYLEQSQLTHYSERKIKDFQDKIETLKKEYQSYLWKLRRLDPSCKDHPWKLRGYKRKRTEEEKVPSWVESGTNIKQWLLIFALRNCKGNYISPTQIILVCASVVCRYVALYSLFYAELYWPCLWHNT
ncbi:hypothetical protein XENTR_v10011903 [Xenopus tropicalis]|nr:hypothetical protein XENTR_v10011903 [Xenopus tropicalis]